MTKIIMKEKVIFDTNTVRNTEVNSFLGGRKELERFAVDAEIVIPFTVIEEIKRQKKVILKSKKDNFLSNPLHRIIGIDENITKAFDVDLFIQKLIDEETIKFETIDLKSNDVLPQIKELALLKKPPFVENDDSDKGFKDAIIYFSVLEYLQEIPNKYIFVCSKDILLKRAFQAHSNVIVIESYEDFKTYSITQFFDEYFLQKLKEELELEITNKHIKEYWNNINDNKVLLIEYNGNNIAVETDSGEIVNTCNRSEYIANIATLVNSSSFSQTDDMIEKLTGYTNYFNNDDILKILNAAYENN
ncbi:DUF4935 domain-containing protein [Chryseobacterium capnotolerans]|uniref:PIN domain-containing protein n=1 Tax=Chryseobacterium TaxID=59732 RepID=UPI00083B05E3|nr:MULTISPECIES: PIN domain-containing protein [Chryseobacterium]UHO39892.1 DUF4935 domain-containing protein [Chryseobacterium capnotolerans]